MNKHTALRKLPQANVIPIKPLLLSLLIPLLLIAVVLATPRLSPAATTGEINRDVSNALDTLYRTTPAARMMAKNAKGILVFPHIIEGSFVVGGLYGEGALRKGGKTTGYYRSIAASYGLQAGAQSFGYALFFLDEAGLNYLKKSEGWEIGVDPTVTIVDKGMAASLSTTTANSGIYAFFFDQKGLMAGISIQGGKITQFTPKP